MSPLVRTIPVAACMVAVGGCASTDPQSFPPAPPLADGETPEKTVDLRRDTPDRFAVLMMPRVERASGRRVAFYRTYVRYRTTGLSSVTGMVGLYLDYFFLDAEGQMVGSARRFLD